MKQRLSQTPSSCIGLTVRYCEILVFTGSNEGNVTGNCNSSCTVHMFEETHADMHWPHCSSSSLNPGPLAIITWASKDHFDTSALRPLQSRDHVPLNYRLAIYILIRSSTDADVAHDNNIFIRFLFECMVETWGLPVWCCRPCVCVRGADRSRFSCTTSPMLGGRSWQNYQTDGR